VGRVLSHGSAAGSIHRLAGVCDSLCVVGGSGTLFAKSSDRAVGEAQVVELLPQRPAGETLRTQHLEIPDRGAFAVLGSRPTWLWGLEHGVNDRRVAIGNERLWTTHDMSREPAGLIGMDLVRLGLELAATASAAVDVMTALLERHGQGGPAEAPDGDPYSSSFLVADPNEAWVLETSGRSWVAKRVGRGSGVAISNRVTLTDDWERSSDDVQPATSVGSWQDDRWARVGDLRLACTLPHVSGPSAIRDPADAAALMRHHGDGPWGRPGDEPSDISDLPDPDGPAGGVTVCMHVRGHQATAASMVCELPSAEGQTVRAWTALSSPCCSIFVPSLPFAGGPPAVLAAERTWRRFDDQRRRAEADPDVLGQIRHVLGPAEAELWALADEAVTDAALREELPLRCGRVVDDALRAAEGVTRSALDRR